MDLVDVDVIGPKPAQRIFELLQNSRATGIAEYPCPAPFQTDLGGNEHARAQITFGERLADDFFGTPESINRSGIDDVDAMLFRGADRGDRFRFVGSAPHPAANRPGADG